MPSKIDAGINELDVSRAYVDSLIKLAQGQRPSYVYDLGRIRRQLADIVRLAGKFGVGVLSPVKAFPAKEVLDVAAEALSGFDVANRNEYELLSTLPEQTIISVTGPSWHMQSWRGVRAGALLLNIENDEQLRAAQMYPEAIIGCRISTDGQLSGSKWRSRFGLSERQLGIVCDRIPVRGLHFHGGFGNNSLSGFISMVNYAVALVERYKIAVEYLNLGGGMLSLTPRSLKVLFSHARSALGAEVRLYIEPGQSLYSDSGFLATKVVSLKEGGRALHVVSSASRDCHLKWTSGNLVWSPEESGFDGHLIVYGSTCYELDYLGSFDVKAFPKLTVGSPLFIGGLDGYAYSWNNGFNGVERANSVFLDIPTSTETHKLLSSVGLSR